MKKRELIQAIERMPHEAEVEISESEDDVSIRAAMEHREPRVDEHWHPVTKAEYVDGKIRLS